MFKKARWLAKSALMVVVSAGMLQACSPDTENGASQSMPQGPLPVSTINPVKFEGPTYVEYTGRFDAVQRVDIRSRVSGQIKDVVFEDGQVVEEGALLFVIDKEPFQIQVDETQARYTIAQREYDRAQELRSNGNISQELLEERAAQVAITKAAYDNAVLSLRYTDVTAPFKGRISRNMVDAGALVTGGNASGTLLTTLVSIDPIHFYFQGNEQDVLRYARWAAEADLLKGRGLGLPVDIKLIDETSYDHRGVIDFIDNELNRATGTKTVRAIVEKSNGVLEPGMFGVLRVAEILDGEMLTVPGELVLSEQTRKYVYVINDKGVADRAYVELGAIVGNNQQVILSGLTTKDVVVAGRLQMIQPGMPLQSIAKQAQ